MPLLYPSKRRGLQSKTGRIDYKHEASGISLSREGVTNQKGAQNHAFSVSNWHQTEICYLMPECNFKSTRHTKKHDGH